MELLPCPFCGGEALRTAHLTYNWFAPVCRRCYARGPSVKIERDSDPQEMRNLMNQADENWNRRASPASVPEVTDGMAIAFHNALTDGAIGQAEVDEIKTGLRAALAAAPTPPVSEDRWQPIETAPKDKFVLLAGPSGYTTIEIVYATGRMCSDYHVGRWIDHANDDLTDWGFEPTHWMPLPKAPAMEGK